MRLNWARDMKYLSGFLLPLFFTSNLFASNLCDSSCELTITFPDGGSIEAVESLTVTFGDGGYVNDGVVVTGFSEGDTLSLVPEEGIVFQANGSFHLGDGGNIDYSDVVIITNGFMDLAAVQGSEEVLVQNITLLGDAILTISSDFVIVENGSFHFFNGQVIVAEDLTFTNYGSFGGLSGIESVVLSIQDESYDITNSVLVQADSEITMTSEEVVNPAISGNFW